MEPKYYRGWHLAQNQFEYQVTAFEWSLVRAQEAFARFVTGLGSVTVSSELKYAEHMILHIIRMQERAKTGQMIARLANRDDVQNVQYSLRKLEGMALVRKTRDGAGNQASYEITDKGRALLDDYRDVRADLLVGALGQIQGIGDQLETATRLMTLLTGVYEEAARQAATITPGVDGD